MDNKTSKWGFRIPQVMLPDQSIDLSKWATVACDQYTSQPEYWKDVEDFVGDSPSTLHIMLPEVYLESADEENRIKSIKKNMQNYLDVGVLVSQKPGFILVLRQVGKKVRTGLIAALDLDQYDFSKGSQSLIRATEKTIVERIPPRLKIREGAPLELPHILILIDDPAYTVIEPLKGRLNEFEKLYDAELIKDGGHIQGYLVNEKAAEQVFSAIDQLADQEKFKKEYGDKGMLLFAVGDGNHSLATAKTSWENIKKTLAPEEVATHPARYALVEIENVHDEGIEFEPIHRVLFSVEPVKIAEWLRKRLEQDNGRVECKMFKSVDLMQKALKAETAGQAHYLPFVTLDFSGYYIVHTPVQQLAVGTLQNALDVLTKETPGCKIDFIHGEDVVVKLGSEKGNMGFFLPAMRKSDLFRTVVLDGSLPRKTFSMGHANEKRYYMECRKIIQ